MDYRRFGETLVVRMDRGEEILEQLKALAEKEHIALASVEALGAVNDFTVGVYNTAEKKYYSNHFEGAYEIVSLTGTVSSMDGQVYLHLHTTLAGQDHTVHGGHVIEMRVGLTCEMFVRVLPGELTRQPDAELGINTIRF